MPNFFDYPQAICEELEKMGYEVDCFDDRPSTNGMVKAIIRVNKNLIGQYINRYFEKVMKTVRAKKYDVVFLISGQSLSFSEDIDHLNYLFKISHRCRLYSWKSGLYLHFAEERSAVYCNYAMCCRTSNVL